MFWSGSDFAYVSNRRWKRQATTQKQAHGKKLMILIRPRFVRTRMARQARLIYSVYSDWCRGSSMKLIKDKLTVITSAFLLLLSPLAFSQEEAPAVEGELIINEATLWMSCLITLRSTSRRIESTSREGRFARERANQAQMLKMPRQKEKRGRRSDRLETTFEEKRNSYWRYDRTAGQLRLGSLRELFMPCNRLLAIPAVCLSVTISANTQIVASGSVSWLRKWAQRVS